MSLTMVPMLEEIAQASDTAPHSRLPSELLAEIFRFSKPDPLRIPWETSDFGLPWTLLWVSTKWRSIASELPDLWNNVSIEYEGNYSGKWNSQEVTKMAHKVLSWSGDTSLSLSIEAIKLGLDVENWAPVIDFIIPHAHRIRHLDLYLHEELMSEVLDFPPLDFECLQHLSLASTDDNSHQGEIKVFRDAPRLRVVNLDLCFIWSYAAPELPWENLTVLSITSGDEFSPIIAHNIIRQCAKLTSLEIMLSSDDMTEDDLIPPATYLFLKTLVVQIFGCSTMAKFLKPFIIPRLTRLELTYRDDLYYLPTWDDIASISVVLSYRQLENLKITLPISNDYNLGPLFESCSNLSKLQLPQLSQSMILLLSSGEWLPKLQLLQVPVTSESVGAHVTMLNSRAEGGFATRGVLVWATRKDRGEFKAEGQEEYLIQKLNDIGLLRFTRSAPT